ncbi:hypothetical protein D7Y05_09290 [bacterium 1XD42-54]|nr:hypothetical protein D7Y05_09290 [bacterium 1XD42-54]
MMDTNSVWEILYRIPIGTVLAWIAVICAIFTAAGIGIGKAYTTFEKTKKIRDAKETTQNMVTHHETQLNEIKEQLSVIIQRLDKQDKSEFKKLRHSIVRAGEEAISNGYITIRSLKSLEELHDDYAKEYDGNGYVDTLMEKVRKLRAVGKLDENNRDVD